METIDSYIEILSFDNYILSSKVKQHKTYMNEIGALCYEAIKVYNVNYDDFYNFAQLDDLTSMIYEGAKLLFNEEEQQQLDFEVNVRSAICHELQKRVPTLEPTYTSSQIKEITKQINILKEKPQPEQRSEEWYAFRNQRITASDFACAMNKNPYSDRKSLLRKKSGENKPFISGAAIFHGVKYEDVAISIYEERNSVKVDEYGCIPHPTLSFIGASPDGICDSSSKNKNYIGRMLEIKCPKSRVLNGTVPEYYYYQVQGQLEVCELEYCDFLQCILREFPEDNFWEDVGTGGNHNYCENGYEKGVLIEYYDTKKEKDSFYYYPRNKHTTKRDITRWIDETIDKILDLDHEFCSVKYWKLVEYDCILVKRDRDLWASMEKELAAFWKEVEHYRKIGYESLLPQKKNIKRKEFWKKELDTMKFETDSEEEEI